MKAALFFLLPALSLLPSAAAEEEPLTAAEESTAPDTHQGIAEELVDLLSRIELCLNSCTDEENVKAAEEPLTKLSAEASALMERQRALPEPTVQDYMASQVLAKDFLTLWKAIEQHIARLRKEGLLSPELRSILQIAPEKEPHQTQQ